MNVADILDVDVIEGLLTPAIVGRKVLVYKSTSSTNDVAWEYARNCVNDGLAVFAENQSSGRGRRGNKWLSADSASILCSILLIDFVCPAELMATVSAVAVAEAIIESCRLDVGIKWPNDVMINGKKAAGILLESRPGAGGTNYVIGIGLNVHQPEDFFENTGLLMPATSLDIATGSFNDRNRIAGELLRSFDRWLEIAKSSPIKIVDRWKRLSTQLGRRVTVEWDQQRFSGNCIGVDPAAGLILQLDNGGVRMFGAAHTTIVKHL
ncbi:MAG: biotin--[acetyl-CoA-carboxylase] ligase [Phycisphaerae bacterium]|nr:biotin--[acetyl-CoA-carboxylase] ligase [Phycisphaerae bacterium]